MEKSEKIILYGTEWCFDCKRAVRILDQMKITYNFIDIDKDPVAADYVQNLNHGNRSVPTIIFPDGSILVEPSDPDLKEKIIKKDWH